MVTKVTLLLDTQQFRRQNKPPAALNENLAPPNVSPRPAPRLSPCPSSVCLFSSSLKFEKMILVGILELCFPHTSYRRSTNSQLTTHPTAKYVPLLHQPTIFHIQMPCLSSLLSEQFVCFHWCCCEE